MGKVTSNLSTTTKQVTGVCNVIIYFINQSLDVTSCTLVNHMVWPPKYFSCYIVEMSGVHIGQLVLVLCGCGSLRKMLDSWGKQVCVCGSGIVPDRNGSSEDDKGQKALKQNILLSLKLKESAGSYYGNM